MVEDELDLELARFLHHVVHADRRSVLLPQSSLFIAIDVDFTSIDLIWSALPACLARGLNVAVLVVTKDRRYAEEEIAEGLLPILTGQKHADLSRLRIATLDDCYLCPTSNFVTDPDLGMWCGGSVGNGKPQVSSTSERRLTSMLAAKNFANFFKNGALYSHQPHLESLTHPNLMSAAR